MTISALKFSAMIAAVLLASCNAETATSQAAPAAGTEPAAEDTATVADSEESTAETTTVAIRTQTTDHEFIVELAVTPEEQTRGLMFRESLPENGGMLFPLETPRFASFWMRNTIIPLDMIFVREDGSITNIARETEPYTLDARRSSEPVIAVLEIRGGRAAELDIEPGDQVSWPGGPRLGEVTVGE